MSLYNLTDVLLERDIALLYMAAMSLEGTHRTVHIDRRNYVYAVGDIPMCFVAHVDTVRSDDAKLEIERSGTVLRNKYGVLGADDRAGIYAIFKSIKKCQRGGFPSILLVNFEEVGLLGVKQWIKDNVWTHEDVLFIEIDRKGVGEYVTYNGRLNNAVSDYVESFGFCKNDGTLSDIAFITREYKTPSINISAGFHNEHTLRETLHVDELNLTIDRLRDMIRNPLLELYEQIECDDPLIDYSSHNCYAGSRFSECPAWPNIDCIGCVDLEESFGEYMCPYVGHITEADLLKQQYDMEGRGYYESRGYMDCSHGSYDGSINRF